MKLSDPKNLLHDHMCNNCGHIQGCGGSCKNCGSKVLVIDDTVPCTCKNGGEAENCNKNCFPNKLISQI